MEFQVYRCTQCGAPELKQLDEGTFKCAYCGTVLRRKKLEEDAKKLSELLEEQTREINERLERIKNNQSSEIEGIRLELAQEKRRRVQEKLDNISNMRKNLYEAIVAEFASNEQIKIRAEKLKDIVPDDFLANFFITAIENDDKAICELIRAVDVEKNYEDIALIITFLIKSLQPSFMLDLCNLIERAYKNTNLEMFEKYSTKFSKEAEKIKQGIYEVALPRDVFVAYSSKDMDKVVELVDVLEKQGLECFVAARNLKHGKGAVENYGSALQEAMYNCKCFVFVSSLNSRSTACDAIKIEIPNIKKLDISNAPPKMRNNYAAIPHEYKKHRVEYRIEESRGFNVADRITNEFFEGYERVYSPEEVAERVLKQITEVHEEFKPQEMPLYSKSPIVQSEVSSNSSDVEGLIQRAVGLLERGDFSYADELFKRVLDKTGDANAEAYLGRLMVDLKARTENELVNLADPFDGHTYFKRAYMYADAQCRKRLQAYVAQSKQNRERIRKDSIYDAAISIATFSHTIEKYEEAISKLSSIHPWKDSGAKMLEYRSEIESIKTQDENKRKNDIYERARSLMRGSNIVDISEAIRLFCTISDWKDSKIRIKDCEQFIEQEAIERKNNTYSRACSMMNGNDPESYKEAIKLFERIRSWKDSSSRINQCHERIKYLSEKKEYDRKKAMYDKAVSLMYLNDFPDHILVRKCEEALELFDQIKGFEDTSIKSIDCKNRIESLRERIEKRRQKEELTKRIKKITKVAVVVGAVLLVAVVVFVGLPQWTYNSGYYTYYITLNGITEFEVPEGSAVINKGAFQGSLTLEKVTIPGTVKTIGFSHLAKSPF